MMRKCSECGRLCKQAYNFCPKCGMPLDLFSDGKEDAGESAQMSIKRKLAAVCAAALLLIGGCVALIFLL